MDGKQSPEQPESRVIVGRKAVLETVGARIYLHPRSRPRVVLPLSKQELDANGCAEYVDPFNVDADWDEAHE